MTKSLANARLESVTSTFDKADWASAYCNVEKELTNCPLEVLKGEIPRELNGVLYRNGPGRLERGGQWIHHPFDGDGMICAFNFKNGSVNLTNKFVRTKAWQEEEKAGKFLYRGVFGSQKKGGIIANAFDVRLKNIANTHVVKLGSDLLALWEASSPHALDPTTLETKGITTLKGTLHPGEAFSAHPRFDPGHNGGRRMVTFGVKTGPKSTLRLMEFGIEGEKSGELINERKDMFNGFAFLHDFAITPNWAIFLQNAISFNPLPFLIGQKGAAQCLSSQLNRHSKFWLIPRESGLFAGNRPKIINGPKGFVFHHLNAWEENQEVILDSIYYQDFPSIEPKQDFREINFDSIPEGILKRSKINLSTNTVTTNTLSKQCCEFGMVNPCLEGMPARYSWMAVSEIKSGNAPLQAIKKLDLINKEEVFWSAAPRGFVGEPLFVSRPNSKKEDDGWVLCMIWNSKTNSTGLVILEAENLTEQAILKLPIKIPHGLHGSWVDSI